jgi:hypothetical protein
LSFDYAATGLVVELAIALDLKRIEVDAGTGGEHG